MVSRRIVPVMRAFVEFAGFSRFIPFQSELIQHKAQQSSLTFIGAIKRICKRVSSKSYDFESTHKNTHGEYIKRQFSSIHRPSVHSDISLATYSFAHAERKVAEK